MVNVTLSVSDELKKKMDQHKIINWSAVAREAIERKLNETISDEEKENINWAVRLQRAGRSGRLDELKKRGLI